MRRLIVNADDFGLTSGINRAILRAFRDGIVRSSTLMARGNAFDEAAALARSEPLLSVGCHVVLVDGIPVLNREKLPSLVPPGAQLRFRESLATFARMAIMRRLDESELEAEITAQIRTLRDDGIQVSHVDSHKHTHMFPVVLRAMLRSAKDCGVRAIRNPFEPLLFASVRQWRRQLQLGILRGLRRSFRSALADAGMVTPDGCIGIAATGGLTLETFCALVRGLPEGTWEFVSHPGYNDSDLDKVRTRLRNSREKELEILTSAQAKEVLSGEQVELISYRQLAEGR